MKGKKCSERCKHCALPMQAGSVLHLCTKFEADWWICSKVIKGHPEIRSRDHGHAHLWVVLWSLSREAPSSMSIPNLKQIALFVQKLLGVPKFRNCVTWCRPPPFRGRFIFHTQAGSVLHLCTKFEADCSIRSKVIKGAQKLGHMTPATPTYGLFYGPYAGRLRPLCLYQIWSG